MGKLVEFVTPIHKLTSRDYFHRMSNSKVNSMIVAKRYDFDYWDGERKFGYGGYIYHPGRWKQLAETFLLNYDLKLNANVLDIGCGKGFLLYELQLLRPDLNLFGIDVSEYAIKNLHPNLNGTFIIHKAQEKYPFNDEEFDLVVSLGTIHNLHLPEIEVCLNEITRVSKQSYIMVESFRNELEMFNVECWALTAETLISPKAWEWLFSKCNFEGDYEFVYFE
jgi:SAM-dependent methyltransferase